ncbi:sodium:solute symporter [Pseudothauera nasutitermitis]|uniref:Sodium:solute symporter n=1 Tax=Pseudothauera nasutitermitis TaxID=2565930 RepID=A0A4S4AVQ9_9RHOO|nr:sodium:solute symporter family protein [Pseudothauera nasutitermitis]THF64048.1 sodium:solute symporter [Pseudothauera nasutitermitis]
MMLWLVVAYLVVSIGIGLIAAARVHNARDYIVAGRNLPMYIVLAMVFATWFGAETVLGISATFLDEGFRGLISDPLGASLCLVLFGLIFARPLYRMNLLTLGDFFRVRYNRQTELILSICIIVSYLGWVGAQITALGLIFDILSQGAITPAQGILIGTAVIVLYTLFGGMWSVAITTFVQMIVIVAGLLYVTWLASDMAGGFTTVISSAAAEGKFEWLPKLDALDILAWTAALVTMALGSIPQQDVFQRVNSSKNENIAVWSTALGGMAYFFFAAVPLFLAYSATLVDPAMVERLMAEDTQRILPTLIVDYMPFTAQVVFFGALLSVIMSTASGTLLAPSVTFSENVVRGFFPGMTDRQLLWTTRVTVAGFAVIVTAYALSTDATIHHMVESAYRVTLAGAFVPLAAGLFWKRANNLGAGLAIAFGLATWLLLEFTMPEGDIEPQLLGLFAAALGMLIGGYVGPRNHHRPHAGHHRAAAATHHAR